jgi:pilus assembly protein CpaF
MEGNTVTLQEIFTFQQTGIENNGKVKGGFVCKGIRPHFIEKIKMSGVEVSHDIFDPTKIVEV